MLSAASAHREDKKQVGFVWHFNYPFMQKVKNAAKTSVIRANPQIHLTRLNSHFCFTGENRDIKQRKAEKDRKGLVACNTKPVSTHVCT